MNIVYLIEWNTLKIDGVLKKITTQINAWEKEQNNVTLIILANKVSNIKLDNIKSIVFKKNILNLLWNRELNHKIKEISPDIIYFRYSAYKPYLNFVLNNYPTIIELNSNINEELKLAKKSLKTMLKNNYIKLTNIYMLKKIKAIVSVTFEILEETKSENKKTIVLPNAIKLSDFKEKEINSNIIPNLIFIGTPNQAWHGIDKIVELAKKTEKELFFHIIGEDKPQNLNLKNINFYGYLERKEYQDILNKADIGIGTLSLHEKNMNEACPLKVREYLAFGLPIIIGYKDTAFKDEKFNYVLELPNMKSNVELNIKTILEFCKKNKNTIISHEKTSKYIDVNFIEKRRISFFKEVI